MLHSFRHVNDNGEETVSTKSYSEDSEYVEVKGEIGVILHDFVIHLTLMGYSKELIAATLKEEFEDITEEV